MEITWKPKTAGILTIIAGCLGIYAGVVLATPATALGIGGEVVDFVRIMVRLVVFSFAPSEEFRIVLVVVMIVIGVIALIRGIFTLRRRAWGVALAGAILALFLAIPLGVLAVIFVSGSKNEFVRAPK
jgi:hypothetical protein